MSMQCRHCADKRVLFALDPVGLEIDCPYCTFGGEGPAALPLIAPGIATPNDLFDVIREAIKVVDNMDSRNRQLAIDSGFLDPRFATDLGDARGQQIIGTPPPTVSFDPGPQTPSSYTELCKLGDWLDEFRPRPGSWRPICSKCGRDWPCDYGANVGDSSSECYDAR